MAQQHKRVQVFRAKQEQKPQQEQKGKLPFKNWAEVTEWYNQEMERLKQEDPAEYEAWVNAPRTDYTPPCIDPDWDPAEMETSET